MDDMKDGDRQMQTVIQRENGGVNFSYGRIASHPCKAVYEITAG